MTTAPPRRRRRRRASARATARSRRSGPTPVTTPPTSPPPHDEADGRPGRSPPVRDPRYRGGRHPADRPSPRRRPPDPGSRLPVAPDGFESSPPSAGGVPSGVDLGVTLPRDSSRQVVTRRTRFVEVALSRQTTVRPVYRILGRFQLSSGAKVGVAVSDDPDELVEERTDLGAPRSEIAETILTAYHRAALTTLYASETSSFAVGEESMGGPDRRAPGARSPHP